MTTRDRYAAARLVVRVAAVLCLLLAALLLGSDAGEYPGYSRAGMRALARGVLPLLAIAALNLHAVKVARHSVAWRAAALAGDLLLLATALRMFDRGSAPPFAWMLAAVAILLGAGAAGLLQEVVRSERSPDASRPDAR